MLEAVRQGAPEARFFQASTCQIFGNAPSPQDEATPHAPNSPYALGKALAHWATANYRNAYGLFAVNGILFNHESPLRGLDAVTRKITDALARMRAGERTALRLGSLDAARDWGYAPEYVCAMHAMLQRPEPHDLVLATGKLTTVRQFITAAFAAAGLRLQWRGEGLQEQGVDAESGEARVSVDAGQFRPVESAALCGNPARAKAELGWSARTGAEELARVMVEADLRRRADAEART
jgi:GDPmannose 4,6-dehydratase